MNFKNFIQNIFSIKKEIPYKIIRILGIKIKFSQYKPICQIVANERRYNANEIFTAHYIKDIHSRTFPKYFNSNTNKTIAVLATGPSMKYYNPINNAKHIGVNKAFQRADIKFDYLFAYDYIAIKSYIDEIINYPTRRFLGIYTSLNDSECFEHNIPMKYRNLPDIEYYVTDNLRNLQHPELSYFGLMDYGSVVFAAIQFALYTNPAKIYIVGCDCSNLGYFNNEVQEATLPEERLLEGWRNIKRYVEVYYPDTEIVSINPIGLRGLFTDIYTEEFINANPHLLTEIEDVKIMKEVF